LDVFGVLTLSRSKRIRHCWLLVALISTNKLGKVFKLRHNTWVGVTGMCILNASLTRHVYRVSHKQLLNVNSPSINVINATTTQTSWPSAGVGCSSSAMTLILV
jgi:hypothetical protein